MTIEQEIAMSNLQELMAEERPTEEQRRRDLEAAIGSFEDCLLEWCER